MSKKSSWIQSEIEAAGRVKAKAKESMKLASKILSEMALCGSVMFRRLKSDGTFSELRAVKSVSVFEGELRLHYCEGEKGEINRHSYVNSRVEISCYRYPVKGLRCRESDFVIKPADKYHVWD